MDETGSTSDTIETVVQRLLGLMLTPGNKLKTRITLFVGAGVSREYGIPTTFGFAQRFFEDAISGIEASRREEITGLSDEEKIATFIREFRDRLNSNLAYAFFKTLEREALDDPRIQNFVTYDRIVHLWASGYIKVVVSTNFDSLIEKAVRKMETGPGGEFKLTVLDYNDIRRSDRPSLIDTPMLLKVTGDIERSNMLWTEAEFEDKIDKTVLDWLGNELSDSLIVLLGYTASEAPLARLLVQHPLYLASVNPRDRDSIPSLASVAKLRARGDTDHAKGLAGVFIERIYEELYQRTKDPALKLSFLALKDRLLRIEAGRPPPGDDDRFILRQNPLAAILDFAGSRAADDRLALLLGDPGYGKTTLVRAASSALAASNDVLVVYIPASELVSITLDEWFTRVDSEKGALRAVCRLVTLIDRSLLVIIDGVNEIGDTSGARAVLNDVTSLLDQFDTGHVRCLVSCRSDYWSRLKQQLNRTYVGKTILAERFDCQEVLDGIGNKALVASLGASRYRWFIDLLRTPQTFGLFSSLERGNQPVLSEFALYRLFLSRQIAATDDAASTLVWLCARFKGTRAVNVKMADADIPDRRRDAIAALADAGILAVNRLEIVRFAGDRIGEFLFGALYLYEYLWEGDARDRGVPVDIFFRSLVETYAEVDETAIDYKIHLLNALVFFVCCCDDDEIERLYARGDAFTRTVVRAAVIQRRTISVQDAWTDDPLLMGAAFLSVENFPRLRDLMTARDHRFFSEIPFNFTAKLFPEEFLTFIEWYLEDMERDGTRLEESRHPTSALLSALFIFLLRNGPTPILDRPKVVAAILSLVTRSDPAFLADRLLEAVEENSRYLFHSNRTDKPSHLHDFGSYWWDRLREAVRGSVFDLSHGDLAGLINLHSMARLLMKFLFCRDMQDDRLASWLDFAFYGDDARIQDFSLGILGWAGKLDPRFIPESERAITLMREGSPGNFFRKSVHHDDGGMSQYDPLVPHVTTLLMEGEAIPIFSLVPERDEKASFRVGRLAEKTILDFPDETLGYLYEAIGENEAAPEMQSALRIAARLYPVVFWTHARRNKPSDLFNISGDDFNEMSRVIAQVRDFDWWNNLSFAVATEERRRSLTRWLLRLLDASDLREFLETVIHAMRSD